MSTAKRRVGKSLPVDLLLEIVACSDVKTIVRFARTCRALRLAILDRAFRRRLALQSAADGGGGGGFEPALLRGVSFLRHTFHSLVPAHRVIHAPYRRKYRIRLDTTGSLWKQFRPVASRDDLLLLRGKRGVFLSDDEAPTYELRVCDTFTGHVTMLPPTTVVDVFPHVFLSVGDDDAGASYELLVADADMRFQTFSSKSGQWGDVRQASVPPEHQQTLHASPGRPAVVINRTVYWMSPVNDVADCEDGILALDVDAKAATMMDLPPGCFSTTMTLQKDKHLLLASVHGRLSLLAAEERGISMWTLAAESTATWTQELVIGGQEIRKMVGLSSSHLPFVLEAFGERSGAVIVRVDGFLRLDLGTKVVTRLHNPGIASSPAQLSCLVLHETNLLSVLRAMKSF